MVTNTFPVAASDVNFNVIIRTDAAAECALNAQSLRAETRPLARDCESKTRKLSESEDAKAAADKE